jgi:hypothetical protein
MLRPWLVLLVIFAFVAAGCDAMASSTSTTASTKPGAANESACGNFNTFMESISASQLDRQEVARARKHERILIASLAHEATKVQSSLLASELRRFVLANNPSYAAASSQELASIRRTCQSLGFPVT